MNNTHPSLKVFCSLVTTLAATLAFVLQAAPTAEAQKTLKRWSAPVVGDSMLLVNGETDFDNDGVFDVVTAGYSYGSGIGVSLHSGATGKKLWDYTWWGSLAPSAVTTGDITGDGTPDVIVGGFRTLVLTGQSYFLMYVLSGKDGTFYDYIEGTEDEEGFIYQLKAINLYGGTDSSVAVGMRLKRQGRNESIVKLISFIEVAWEECSFNTGLPEAISDMYVVADQNGDDTPDLLVGVPDAKNGTQEKAGVVFLISGSDCSVIQENRGPIAGLRAGAYFSPVGDWNGDGIEDFASGSEKFFTIHSGKDTTSLGKTVVPPADISLTGPMVVLTDMNADGFTDFGSVAIDPKNTDLRRAVFLSGKDNAVLGNFALAPFGTQTDTYLFNKEHAGFFPRLGADLNKDGVRDVTFFVRSFFEASGYSANNRAKVAEITTISGACPREAEITFINTPEGARVAAGERPVFAKVTACGLDLSGSLVLKVGGVEYPMYDTGDRGDAAKGDRIYTAQARLATGQNTLQVKGTVDNSGVITVDKSVRVTAINNYKVEVKNSFEWIDPKDHTLVKPDRYDGYNLTLPFSFPLYGRSFNKMFASQRGILLPSFADNKGVGTSDRDLEINQNLPSSYMVDPVIAPAWGRMDFGEKSALYIKTLGTPGNQRFVMTFEGFDFYLYHNPESRVDYQVVFHQATGRITTSYKTIYSLSPVDNLGSSLTVGIQGSPFLATVFSYREAFFKQPVTIEFVPGQVGSEPVLMNPTLGFVVTQSATSGARLAFDVRSSNPEALPSLTDCTYSLFAGQGATGDKAQYGLLGSRLLGGSSQLVTIRQLWQPILALLPIRGPGQEDNLFLRAGVSCPKSRVNLISEPQQLTTSRHRSALRSSLWFRLLGWYFTRG
ncbi:MAG: FG-GAP repeat domain-containing protein [Pseudomonadota bacterium]|jgi:hypothetical protein